MVKTTESKSKELKKDKAQTEADSNALLYQDLPRIILLVILYSFQGLTFGFFESTVQIVFKKYLTYSELGVLSWCSVPFSLKLLWAPLIEKYYSKSFGKRKSWIVPAQLLMCIIFIYLGGHIESLLEQKEVYFVSALLTFLIFIITC